MDVRAYLKDYLAGYKHYKPYWNYEDGCVLLGCIDLYEATGDPLYRDFVLAYLREAVTPAGEIPNYEFSQYNIDSINSGKALFFAWKETGDDRYRKAIELHMQRLREHPRCACGNFWHKSLYPQQIWLDGLYMAQPFYVEYESRFGTREGFKDTLSQFKNVRKYLFDENKKLYYHGYDESRSVYWADPVTGLSKSFWLRSIGWLLMAFVDCYELMDCSKADKQLLADLLKEAVDGLLAHQDKESCLFYQVVDMPELPGNYLETSGSAMVAYALLKGFRLGMLQKEAYKKHGEDILCGLCARHMRMDGGRLHLTQICRTGGLGPASDLRRDGTPEYYVSEPIMEDNGHGAAALIMAYSEYLRLRA